MNYFKYLLCSGTPTCPIVASAYPLLSHVSHISLLKIPMLEEVILPPKLLRVDPECPNKLVIRRRFKIPHSWWKIAAVYPNWYSNMAGWKMDHWTHWTGWFCHIKTSIFYRGFSTAMFDETRGTPRESSTHDDVPAFQVSPAAFLGLCLRGCDVFWDAKVEAFLMV